jgi:transcriptional regulator GlxA family with amidase domain
VILAYPGMQALDLVGPLEVFHGASQLLEADGREVPGYAVEIVAPGAPSPITSASGMAILAGGDLASVQRRSGRIDTLIVPGGAGKDLLAREQSTIDWIRATSQRARRTAGVCTGTFLLAAAGLLDGRRATTHWAFAEQLARERPAIEVDAEPIFVRDGALWTSAGVTAGMDLALALVEEDHDRQLALTIARHLVLFLRRPGNQSQFSATLGAQQPSHEPLREVQRHVLENLQEAHTVEALAARAHMSPRHFARAFRAQTGVTPARYVERVRLEAARRHLEDSSQPIAHVAGACGFGTPETMRRAFLRSLHVGPAEYRRRFHTTGGEPSVAA